MPGGSVSSSSSDVSNEGAGNDKLDFSSTGSPKRVVPIGTETESVAVIANPNNTGIIFIGFNEDVTSSDGFPLEAGVSLSLDLDVNQDDLHAVADSSGDSLHWIALS